MIFLVLRVTHYCSKSQHGKFRVKRKTSRKKLKAKIQECKVWLRQNMHAPIEELIKMLTQKLVGHFRYYGVSDNIQRLKAYRYIIRRKLFGILNRRSQRKNFTWEKFAKLEERFPLAKAKIYVNIYGSTNFGAFFALYGFGRVRPPSPVKYFPIELTVFLNGKTLHFIRLLS